MIIQNAIVKFMQTILRYDKIIEEKYKAMSPEQRQFKVKCITYTQETYDAMGEISANIGYDIVDLLKNTDENIYTQKLNNIKENLNQLNSLKKSKLIIDSDTIYKYYKENKEAEESLKKTYINMAIDRIKSTINQLSEENFKKFSKGLSYSITVIRTLSHFQTKIYLQLVRDCISVIAQAIKSTTTKTQEE